MFGYDKAKEIAVAIAAHANDPARRLVLNKWIPFECVNTDKARTRKIYNLFRLGGARRGPLSSRNNFICRMLILEPSAYEAYSDQIELYAIDKNGTERRWYGDGAAKTDSTEQLKDLTGTKIEPFMRINLGRIIGRVSHLLESSPYSNISQGS